LALSVVALMIVYPVIASSVPAARPSEVGSQASSSNKLATNSFNAPGLHPATLNPNDKFQAPGNVQPSRSSLQVPAQSSPNAKTMESATTTGASFQGPPALTVGETISFTSTSGTYGNFTNAKPIGTAAGTVTFTVTGALREGYTLTLSSGSLALGNTTVSLTGGSAVMGIGQANLVGSGTLSGGSMIYHATARPSLLGNYNILSIDLQMGGQEYLVLLQVTSSHS